MMGKAPPSLVSVIVEELSHLDDDSAAAEEEVAVNVAASAYTGEHRWVYYPDLYSRPLLTDKQRVSIQYVRQRKIHKSSLNRTLQQLHSAITAFLLAMSLYPDVQKKVQAELDTVVGPNRLPELGDYESHPYTKATVKEALRWHSAAPMLIPHTTVADDVYNGCFIPEGSMVMFNAW